MVAKTTSLACYTTQARELILFIILEELLFSQPYELVLTANIEHWDCVRDFKEFLGKSLCSRVPKPAISRSRT